jgi:hypothetical protein
MLLRHLPQGREVLRALLVDRMTFTPAITNYGSSPFRVGDFGMISHRREHAGEDLEA